MAAAAAAAGPGSAAGTATAGSSWEEVKRSWSQTGVGCGLVRFLRSTAGTTSEALLCGWAEKLPAEEQAKLTALLRPGGGGHEGRRVLEE